MKTIPYLCLISLLFYGNTLNSQENNTPSQLRESFDFEAEQIVKKATSTILRYVGLPQDFVVVQKDIPNVIAYTKHGVRYIGYNPQFIQRLRIQTETDWSAYSVLAHEIGHHLAGHTEKHGKTNPGNELVADHFSGFILQRMGASLLQSESALLNLEKIGGISDTIYHPPVNARITSLAEGWRQAASLSDTTPFIESTIQQKDTSSTIQYLFKCQFSGDENVYYIDSQDNIIWFNEMGKAIKIGKKQITANSSFIWLIEYGRNLYGVDSKGIIWSETNYKSAFKVGTIEEFVYDINTVPANQNE